METRTQTTAGTAIARALLGDSPPAERVTGQPWQIIATYMMMSSTGDVCAALLNYAATLSMTDRLAVGALVGGEILSASQDGGNNAQQPSDKGKKHIPTHDELRDEWAEAYPLTAFGLGAWRVYNDGVWGEVEKNIILKQITRACEAAKPRGIRPTDSLVKSVTAMAVVEKFIPAKTWNASQDLLVCKNGMLEISTKTLLPHDPDSYQTTGVSFSYDPAATCPTFEDALTRLPYDTVQFLQEFFGYCLTTDTSHELALWFVGMPGCGKSTIIGGINGMLGSRVGLISLRKMNNTEYGIPELSGKTMLYTTENNAGMFDNTADLNAIISGEAVVVEKKLVNIYSEISHAKLVFASNKLPRIRDAGDGIFRRIKVIHFTEILESEKDETYKQRIADEAPGILMWALAGLDRLHARGRFDVPREVSEWSENFRAGNDPEKAFLTECCDYDPLNDQIRVQSSELYTRYRSWCIDNGHKPKSNTTIVHEWKRLKLQKVTPGGRAFWIGAK